MKDYRQLAVWQRSHQFTLRIHALTKSHPKEELFGLTSQLRRASFSVPANFADGCHRDTEAEVKRLTHIAHGPASEVEYLPLHASEVGLITARNHQPLADEISPIKRMLGAFARKLKADC